MKGCGKSGVCVLFFLLLLAIPVKAAEVLERIVAVVNDEIITEQDIQIVMMPVESQFRTIYVGRELEEKLKKSREEFLTKLIEDKLILSQAKAKKVIVKDEEVEEMMREVRNKFPNRELFLRSVKEQGLNEKKLRDRFQEQLFMQKLVGYEVRSKISVSPGEVMEYYKSHPEEFTRQERVKLKHLLIRIGARTEEEAKTLAEKLEAQLVAGQSFEDIAKTYSEGAEAKQGGQMGWVEKGQLLGEIDAKVFSAKKGEVTPPIQTSLGYHIFQVEDIEKFSIRPFEEVKDKIYDQLFKKKLAVKLELWIANLKKNAYISIRET